MKFKVGDRVRATAENVYTRPNDQLTLDVGTTGTVIFVHDDLADVRYDARWNDTIDFDQPMYEVLATLMPNGQQVLEDWRAGIVTLATEEHEMEYADE